MKYEKWNVISIEWDIEKLLCNLCTIFKNDKSIEENE